MTETLGSSGRELLLELQRGDRSSASGNRGGGSHSSNSSDHNLYLPSYNTKLVRSCLEELHDSVRALSNEVHAANAATQDGTQDDGDAMTKKTPRQPNMEVRPSILLHSATIQRHKRCLLAYHKVRMDRVKQQIVLGNGGSVVPSVDASATSTEPKSAAEIKFAQDYQQLRMQYASAQSIELDQLPPTSHMIQVRVLVDQGEIVLESGRTVSLSRGSLHYLPRTDVQPFLRTGSLELVDGEEVDF